jgi:hypothetical protein
MASISLLAWVSPESWRALIASGMIPEIMDATRLYENWAILIGFADMAS